MIPHPSIGVAKFSDVLGLFNRMDGVANPENGAAGAYTEGAPQPAAGSDRERLAQARRPIARRRRIPHLALGSGQCWGAGRRAMTRITRERGACRGARSSTIRRGPLECGGGAAARLTRSAASVWRP
jgi:hypothetical protein